MSKKQASDKKREAKLRIALPTGEAQKYKVTGREIHIGSGPHDDIRISDPEISTTQAMLVFDGDSYSVIDEGGKGGTLVNAEAVTKPRRLSHGDVITMGKSQITFKFKHGKKGLKRHFAPVDSAGAAIGAEPSSENGESGKKKHKKDKKAKAEEKTDERPELAAGATPAPNGGAPEAGEKKKKDKKPAKDKKDERVRAAMVRAWGGIIGTILTAVLTVGISVLLTRQGANKSGVPDALGGASQPRRLSNLSDNHKFSGGKFEASGAVAVPDSNGILFVDDSKPDRVFYMPVNALGEQDGPVKAIPLGVTVEDPEGISQFGSRFAIVGSLSTHESNEKGGVVFFDFDPSTQTVFNAVVLTGMRKFLFDNVPELKAWANKTGVEGGLNIEGITVDPDPQHPRVLLGLRGPVLNGNALVVPIKILDRKAPLSLANLAMDEPNAIQLNLKGQAIRDIQYDSQLRAFLIISGAPETEEKTDFMLWQWNGDANQAHDEAKPKQQSLLDKKMKPEGIAPLKIGDQAFVFIVGDSSSYARIEYTTP